MRPSKYLSKRQVADRFGVSVRTVQRWIATGKLRALRLGQNTVRISEDDLQDLVRDAR